ncbi:roadblock/LC7 domain-containing protein [Micromonospora sp. NPDC049559]|uniref:roadblock/LC7 domain-containing protein n=1 Tax=Micromonospora sp. NPDC049559 TaxID=3155923 RepID=UPI003446D723
MDFDAAVAAELHRLRWHRDDVSGTVLSGLDGMLVASDLPGVDAHHVAALAATSFGLGQRFAETVGRGQLREHVLRSACGFVISYPAGEHALLSVVARPEADPEVLGAEAHDLARRLGTIFDDRWRPAAEPSAGDPYAPLALRTPMAALPDGLRTGFDLRLPPNF